MFVTLTNGKVINTAVIKLVQRTTAQITDPSISDEERAKASDRFWGESLLPKVPRPAINIALNERDGYELIFETEAEREAEMTRLERALRPSTTALFSNLALDLELIRAVHYTREVIPSFRSNNGPHYRLNITIVIDGGAAFNVVVKESDPVDFPNAKLLFERFNLPYSEKVSEEDQLREAAYEAL